MEALRKLEHIQTLLSLMQSRNIISSSPSSSGHHDSEGRFVANLLLLLIQPCGELDMDAKFRLVSHLVTKISATFLQEASLLLNEEGHQRSFIESASPVHLKNDADSNLLQTDFDDMAMIGLDAMEKASSTLEDFCRSYFMFHGLDVNNPHSVFQYLHVLSFTESYIYKLDNFNEKLLHLPTNVAAVLEDGSTVEGNLSCLGKITQTFKTDPFGSLVLVLKRYELLTERISEELKYGEEYWALERKLCCALMSNKEILLEDVMRAIHLKSFDYRILNLLLYQLRREKVDDLHMEFLSASEFLVEIADDLFDYEDDVLGNNFNILRMFVRLYGPSVAPNRLAKSIAEAEERYDELLKKLDPELAMNYQRRCEEATREGGKISGPALGTWNIPAVIADEESYRSSTSNRKMTTATFKTLL